MDRRRRTVVAAAVVALGFVLSACGQASFVAAPDPHFTSGERAAPSSPTTTLERQESETILPEDVEGDVEGDVEADGVPVAVDRMTAVDDAGQVGPNGSRWDVFDGALADRLSAPNDAVSVAVMVDGELVHEAAFGERVPGDPAEVGDRFRIGSISKTITAIVVLQLVEDGELTLDEPVGPILVRHLGLTSYDPDVDRITVRELLSHTAGLPTHQHAFFGGGAASCRDAAIQGLSSDVRGPGGYEYANLGYCVLGMLIEAVTGTSYERAVNERLLTPLGIGDMRMAATDDLGPGEVSHHPTPGRNYMEALGAAGAWIATPSDLVTIVNAIDPDTPGWKALSPDTMRAMRYRLPGPQAPSGYGLGLINYGADGFGHSGTIEHAHALVLVRPDGVTWAVTVAGEYPSDTTRLRSIVAGALAAGFPGA